MGVDNAEEDAMVLDEGGDGLFEKAMEATYSQINRGEFHVLSV